MKEALSQRRELLKTVALGVIHDLAQPLTALSFYIDALDGTHVGIPLESKVSVNGARFAIARIQRLISTFRRAARRDEAYTTKEVVEDCLSLLEYRQRSVDATFEVAYNNNTDKMLLEGDRSITCLCMLTVLSNALDAVSDTKIRKIRIETHNNGTALVLNVFDTGRGLPTHESFSFMHVNTNGLGIGLANAKEALALSCKGTITARSIIHEYDEFRTVFEIKIPVKRAVVPVKNQETLF